MNATNLCCHHEDQEEMQKNNRKYGDFAVLYRTNAQSRTIEEAFVKANMPYKMVGGHKFYDRKRN